MARPNEYLTWNPSLSNVIDPPGGLKATGYLGGVVPGAQHHNWIFNLIDRWIQALDQGYRRKTVVSSGPYSILTGDGVILAVTTAGAFQLNLPKASTVDGMMVQVKQYSTNANAATVAAFAGDTIDTGADTSVALGYGECISLVADSASNSWAILSKI